MKLGEFTVDFLAHVFFRFRSPGGKVLLTDPLYTGRFFFEGHWEEYLTPPAVKPAALGPADLVFVSHRHGDHCDPPALKEIQDRTGARVVGPAEVVEALAAAGLDQAKLDEARPGAVFRAGDLALETHAGYDQGLDDRGRPNKFAAVIASGATRLFYSGDCNNPPPDLAGSAAKALFLWPHPREEKLLALCRAFDCRRLVLMHGDRFEPGRFFCNYDLEAEKARIQPLLPDWEIIVPERLGD